MQKTLYILYYIQAFHLFVIHKITPYQEVNFDWVLKNLQHLNRVIMLWGYMFLINKIVNLFSAYLTGEHVPLLNKVVYLHNRRFLPEKTYLVKRKGKCSWRKKLSSTTSK